MVKLIVETDLGHDPDDFFAICYLAAAGVDIRAITLVPGLPYQVALAKVIIRELGLDIPIGVSNEKKSKYNTLTKEFASCGTSYEEGASGGIHRDILNRYYPNLLQPKHDGLGHDVIADVLKESPDSELFIIGPATNVRKFLEQSNHKFKRITMQGGFLPYFMNLDIDRLPILDKFSGIEYVGTFNLNGDRKAVDLILNSSIDCKFVGKHVCHTVEYNAGIHKCLQVKNRASELFREAGDLYFKKHSEKKFHDPTAAVCHLHPEIATWCFGKPVKLESGWTTRPSDKSYTITSIDYDKLWEHITNFT